MELLNTVVVGAYGKMGREVVKGVLKNQGLQLVGAVDVFGTGQDIGAVIGQQDLGILIKNDLAKVLDEHKVHVIIDFTHKQAAKENITTALKRKVFVVTGTTGFTPEELQEFDKMARDNQVGIFFAPNFSLGAVLMMKYSKEIAKYFPQAEILEYHNDKKKDSPSGTAIATAEGMRANSGSQEKPANNGAPSRGGEFSGYQIHSIRLKSCVAHQEVLFAGDGEILTIRHHSYNRECFIPGVMLAVRQVINRQGLTVGLDSILDDYTL